MGWRMSGVVATGSMSDPYNPLERRYGYTRGLLELLDRYRFGAAIATKGTLVERDIDLLQRISTHSPVIVKVTITTPHDTLSALVEPHAPPSSRRLAALEALSKAGIFAGVLLMPVLPFLEDDPQDIRLLVQLCAKTGVNCGTGSGNIFCSRCVRIGRRSGNGIWTTARIISAPAATMESCGKSLRESAAGTASSAGWSRL